MRRWHENLRIQTTARYFNIFEEKFNDREFEVLFYEFSCEKKNSLQSVFSNLGSTQPIRETDTILKESIVFRLIRFPKHLIARQSIR